MGVSAVFIDGGYLDKVLHFEHGGARIDYSKLVRQMVQPDELLKREGVLVTLWHGGFTKSSSPARELVEVADERRELTAAIVGTLIR